MPTQAQMQELITNTAFDWTTINGVNGNKFTAANGNYVFFPASGYYSNGSQSKVGKHGIYWSSSPSGSGNAYTLFFYIADMSTDSPSREGGYPVRPVMDA